MKKRISFVLTLVLLFSVLCAPSAAALERRTNPYISYSYAGAFPIGDGVVRIDFTVTGTRTMNEIGASTINVYKSDGSLVSTFSHTDLLYSYMMNSNTVAHTGSVVFNGVSGQYYYAVATLYAEYGGSGTETITTATVKA